MDNELESIQNVLTVTINYILDAIKRACLISVQNETDFVDRHKLNENDLPLVIQSKVNMLNNLNKKVSEAIADAETARRSARTAYRKSAGFFHRRATIEALQLAGLDLARAVVAEAEAQKISFEFQTKIAVISKYLFWLGVSNITSNRIVVRELELKLKDASDEELTELSRQELTNVVRQLKEQEDFLVKQANLFKITEDHDKKLKAQLLKTEQHEKILRLHTEINREHYEELHIREKKDKEQDSYLEGLQKTYHEMEKHIEEQSQVIEAMKIKFGQLNDKVENLHPLLTSKMGRFITLVSFIISVVALAGAVIFIFIK
jgi:hypothetical protein